MKNPFYTVGHPDQYWNAPMPKTQQVANFGERLAKLRKAAGFTQKELGDEIGVSRRMITYYESQSAHPPTHVLPAIAKALGLSTDELLGVKAVKKKKPSQDTRLQRRFQQIEKLPAKDKRQLIQLIDTFLEAAQYRKSA
jgi:transcriptional regulator with XRE-family HTH domain